MHAKIGDFRFSLPKASDGARRRLRLGPLKVPESC